MADPLIIEREVFPRTHYPEQLKQDGSGLHEELFSELRVPEGADAFAIILSRDDFPDTPELVAKCRAELSINGETYSHKPKGEENWEWGVFPIAFTTCGTPAIERDGTIGRWTWMKAILPQPENPRRHIRVTLIPIKSISTKVLCEFRVPA